MSSVDNADIQRDAVEKTAYIPAVMRAIDSVSPHRLVYDSVSLMLIPPVMFDSVYERLQEPEFRKTTIDFHAFRARCAYDIAMIPEVLPQTVILGAGLDTLAWRESQLKDIYEIDQSEIALNKVKKLPKPINQGKHVMIQADLAINTWEQELIRNGFDSMLPTVWIMEGLLVYYTKEVTNTIFQTIDQLSAKGSRVFFDHWPSSYAKAGTHISKILQSYVDNPIEEFQWFIKNGWDMKKMIDFGENGEHYGRRHQTFFLNGIPLGLYFVSAYKIK